MPKGQKSSANPKLVDDLEGKLVHQVACGTGHTLFLIDAKDVEGLPEWDPPSDDVPEPEAKAEGITHTHGRTRARTAHTTTQHTQPHNTTRRNGSCITLRTIKIPFPFYPPVRSSGLSALCFFLLFCTRLSSDV